MSEAVVDTPAPEAPAPEATEAPAVAAVETPAASPSAFDQFRGSLDADLRANPLWDQYKERGLEGVAKDFANAQALIGSEKRISRPGDDAAPEDWDRFYNTLGRPESAEGYDLGDFAPPEGLPWDAEQQQALMGDMHGIGLTNDQMSAAITALAGRQNEAYQGELQAAQAAVAESETALRTEWGAAYEAKLELAEKASVFAFGEGTQAIMEADIPGLGKFGSLPIVVKAMAKIGEAMSEDKLVDGKTQRGGVMTASSAKTEYERMQNDPDIRAVLADGQNPEHEAMSARWKQVAEMAFPNTRNG